MTKGFITNVVSHWHEQRVAIWRGTRDRLRGGRRIAAGAILDHDRLAPVFAQFLADKARDQVGRPAGREGHHQSYRAVRVGFGVIVRQCLGCKRERASPPTMPPPSSQAQRGG